MRQAYKSLLLALTLSATSFHATKAQETHAVHFSAGTSSATIHGTVKGDDYVDYQLAANASQQMKVSLNPESVYFNVMPPGSSGEAIFIGSQEGGAFSGTLSAAGTYTVRVYQMGAAASGGKSHKFTLDIGVR